MANGITEYFQCKCGTMVNADNLAESLLQKRLCPKCKDAHFHALVENKIWNADRQTLDYLLMFFTDKAQALKYGWTVEQCTTFVSLIRNRISEDIPLSYILTRGKI